jgi:hypothetical protein
MDTQGNSWSNRDILAAPPLDSPEQELNLFWLIVGGGFLLSLIRDSWLLLVALGFFVYWCIQRSKDAERTKYLRAYEFPAPVPERVRKRYPHLSEEQLSLVMLGLRQYFILCNAARGGRVSMPSHAVDAAWHEFILFTREYAEFCNKGLNRFLHHVPASVAPAATASTSGADAGMKTAWRLACKWERIDPRKPERLPFLFEIDARFLIPDGFRHPLDNDYAVDGNQPSEGGEGASGEGSGCGCGGCDGG